MKCPTCGYIGFEASDRCRNCGYDFTLGPSTSSEAPASARLAGTPEGALRELDIRPSSLSAAPVAARTATPDRQPDLDKVLQNLDRVLGDTSAADLPLFHDADETVLAPLVDPAAAPRRPLSVRRATPDPARLRSRTASRPQPEAPRPLELPLPDAEEPTPVIIRREPATATNAVFETPIAPPARRLVAAGLDLAILAAIDLIVVYFTLRLCGLSTADVLVLPPIPLIAFFTIVNGGYLAAFTAAGGQTIGKMALGIKVVGHADLPVSSGLAVVRALACLASAASLGLGFLPALLGADGRAIEDRLADTRVVRVTG